MSGHSKWATIHRQKEANDAKRGAAFTKLGRAISIAVKEGGGIGDPEKNFKLRLAIEKARQFNMPKENISRAIERAAGNGGEQLEESMFEGFLPGGAAVLVQTLSDNRLRTAQQVREIIDKGGGNMASQGAVGYMFSQLGEIIAINPNKDLQEAELEIIDLGVEDVDVEEGKLVIHTPFDKTSEIKEKLEGMGYRVESIEIIMHPTTLISVDENTQSRIETMLEKLEDLDDVQKVWSNYS